jgi:hypothetical protein
MPFSIMKEHLYEFINNIKYHILIQEKNKAFIEKRKRVEIYVKETKQLGLSDDEYLKKCYGEFKLKINAVVKEFKNEIKDIIKDMEKIYKTITEASNKLETIFKIPLDLMNNKYHHDVSIEKIHKKIFLKIIQNDAFIRSLIVEVNSNEYNFFGDLKNLIKNYEVEITQTCVLGEHHNCSDEESCCENYLSDDSFDENSEASIFDFKDNIVKFNDFVKLTMK